jgi:hypothetical protein
MRAQLQLVCSISSVRVPQGCAVCYCCFVLMKLFTILRACRTCMPYMNYMNNGWPLQNYPRDSVPSARRRSLRRYTTDEAMSVDRLKQVTHRFQD